MKLILPALSACLVVALAAMAFAGSPTDHPTAAVPATDATRLDTTPGDPGAAPAKTLTQCTTASGCEFWDNDYHEYVLYDLMDTANIDVLIVPELSPFATRDITTIRKSIDAWDAGIDDMAAPWLADNLTIHAYTLGIDTPPQEAIEDPEIIVVTAEYNPVLLFGIGEEVPVHPCSSRSAGGILHDFPVHDHDGMQVHMAECKHGGFQCVALNTNFLLGGPYRLYDLVAHEFGHCLGGGHVGDALDFDAKTFPHSDIMSYQYDASQVFCVSNLNTAVLEGLYGHLFGRPASERLYAGDYYTMATADYAQTNCPNPW
jgi:hypothetical protein